MTYGSLFTGVGGIDLGLDRAGMECHWQIELDDYCVRVLSRRWPEVKRYADIRNVAGSELEPVDLIAGGFPCQDLSQAGRQTGFHHSDGTPTRSGLWFEFARLVRELRPRYVLVENVPGLLVRGALDRVIGELARLGYVGSYRCLRASDFGAAHLRKRVFLVAYCAGNRRGVRGAAHNGDGDHASGDLPDRRDPHVAHGSSGGFGELWKPPRSDGFVDGRDQRLGPRRAVADTARDEQPGPDGEAGRLRRRGVREPGEPLADTECAQRRQDVEYDGPARGREQAADRSGGAGEVLADTEEHHRRRGVNGAEAGTGQNRIRQRGPSGGSDALADAEYAGPPCGGTAPGRGAAADESGGSDQSVADAGNGFLPVARRGPERRDGPGSAGAEFSWFCEHYSVCHNPNACDGGDSRHYGEFPPGCWLKRNGREYPEGFEPELADAECAGLEIGDGQREQQLRQDAESLPAGLPSFAPGPSDPRWPGIIRARPDLAPAVESAVRRVADGFSSQLDRAMSNRTKRLGRLGNAVVPACAEWIAQKILEFEKGVR